MKKVVFWLISQGCFLSLLAQVAEDFTDGDFSNHPPWTGTTTDWIINSSQQLQSNNTKANSTFYLSTANTQATNTQWDFYVRLHFNPSAANYTDVFLIASAADITATTTTGYFVRIGHTQDEVSLFRKDANGTIIKMIDGADDVTNTADNSLKIRVIRNADHTFTLFRSTSVTGNSYLAEGTAIDTTYTTSQAFGILVKQSTASFFQKHYFDDIAIASFTPDIVPPAIQTATATTTTNLDILFSEPVDLSSSQITAHYTVSHLGIPATAQRDATNTALVHLSFTAPFTIGFTYTLTTNGITDLSGNTLTNGTAVFSFNIPQRFDVIINEIMADPSPAVDLPEAEYIELKNTSGSTLNLQGWRITAGPNSSGPFPFYELPADSFLIITTSSAASQFTAYGRVLGVPSFPALVNEGALLALVSKEGKTIHAVHYADNWYDNTLKKEGGWSLEMIDPANPCGTAANWEPSIAPVGGTPGKKNTVDGLQADATPPSLKQSYAIGTDTIVLIFDEPLDSTAAATISHYSMTNNTVTAAIPIAPLFNTVKLTLGTPLQPSAIYTVSVQQVTDCKGNTIGIRNSTKAGLPEGAVAGAIIINEILFNPKANNEDYVEFYNRSHQVIDASTLYIGNRSSNGSVASLKRISGPPFYLFPGDYLAVTADSTAMAMHYLLKNPDAVRALSSLPSFPDAEGTVVLVNGQGAIIDEVHYNEDWHFALITNKEGIALERIDPNSASSDKNNWHSAAATAGYGTPGYQNSQFGPLADTKAVLTITPKVFSPDNDGLDDIATISYTLTEPGYVANIIIFNTAGVQVRHLVKNGMLGLKGSWTWDGLNERKQEIPTGSYIIYTELFNVQGKKERFKHTVVLARKR